MAARTVSELANWDGRLSQQRQDSKWRRSSSNLARDPYHTPLENQPFEIFQSPGRFLDQKRTEQSASRSDLERDLLVNSPENARLLSRVDTTSTPSHDVHHFHHPSILHTVPNKALPPSPFISSSRLSRIAPNSSVHASRVHNSRPSSSREHITSLQPGPTIESEVIDLTIESTEDELSVRDVAVSNSMPRRADPGPSRRPSSPRHSSPLDLEQSLFTPPRSSKRRPRVFMDYLAVPALPKGLTKTDYQPMTTRSVVPVPGPTATNILKDSSLAESSIPTEPPPLQTWKGKEREHDIVSSPKHERHTHVNVADVAPSAPLDAFDEYSVIPLEDEDDYPPLSALGLATNTRFQFVHAWREQASRFELDGMFKFRLLGKACIWVQSVDTLSPRIPGTAGYVSSEQLRPWQLVPPDSPRSKHVLDQQADATESRLVVGADANCLSLSDDALPVPSVAVDPALSNSTLSQGFPSTAVDVEHDMNQYFNGLSDSPSKHVPRQPAPINTFRPHLLQSAGHAQMNPLDLVFPSLEPDSRFADTLGHECFLGVPPSPTTADMEPLTAPGLTPDSPFAPVDGFRSSLSNIFGGEDAWPFEQGEGLLLDNNSPSNSHAPPTALGTIDPSLLGPERPQAPSRATKGPTVKRQSKLPEPVIYIRRPIDSSTLPLVSGKRTVQIKYRDPEGSPATPSTQSVSQQTSLNPVELATNDMDDSSRAKRYSAPSRKRRGYHTPSDSDSNFIPETAKPKPKIKIKIKRPSVKDKESLAEDQGADAGTVSTVSFCHQCRHTSGRPKMVCSNMADGRACGKRFCNRCILYRYPEITFDQHSASFLCPACTNTCNCSCCARSRGEEFVSMRLGGLAASILKTKVTLVRDVGKPLRSRQDDDGNVNARRSASHATTPTPEPGALPMQSQFWAHVYGIEGERVGSAFMTRGASLMQPPPPPPRKERTEKEQREKHRRRREKKKTREKTKTKRGPRVFIGCPRASWGIRGVRDVEPSVDVGAPDEQRAGTSTATARRRRCYIGSRAALYEPYGRMPGSASPTPVLDSDGSLTPLSELELELDGEGEGEGEGGMGYWPQPEVGECCSWAPPPPPGTIDGLSLAIPGAVGLSLDVDTDMGVAAIVDERGSASTALSEEDMVRAISAALAAVNGVQPAQ